MVATDEGEAKEIYRKYGWTYPPPLSPERIPHFSPEEQQRMLEDPSKFKVKFLGWATVDIPVGVVDDSYFQKGS